MPVFHFEIHISTDILASTKEGAKEYLEEKYLGAKISDGVEV